MADNIVIKIDDRPPDATAKVPMRAVYSDKNFGTLQDAIQDRSDYIPAEGLISSPMLSVVGMTFSWSAFKCLAPGGILCSIPAGSSPISTALAGVARVDVITVNPEVVLDGDSEIDYSGLVSLVAGTDVFGFAVVPAIPASRLKIGEIDIAAGSVTPTLRSWKANYVKVPSLKAGAYSVPTMYVEVNPYRGYVFGTTLVDFAGGSYLLTAPGSSGVHRIDLLTLTSSGALSLAAGVGVTAPAIPTAPTYPTDTLPICEVWLRGEQAFIMQDQIKDVRPFSSALAGDVAWGSITGKPTAPSLEEMATEHDADGKHAGKAVVPWGDVTSKPTSPSLEEMAAEHEADGTHMYKRVWTTLSFAYVGTLGVKASFAPSLVAPCDLEIDKAYGYVKTTPVGSSIIVDFLINGASVFATQADMINITNGNNADESNTPGTTTISKNDIITASILSIPAGAVPGADLTAHLRCMQTIASLP